MGNSTSSYLVRSRATGRVIHRTNSLRNAENFISMVQAHNEEFGKKIEYFYITQDLGLDW